MTWFQFVSGNPNWYLNYSTLLQTIDTRRNGAREVSPVEKLVVEPTMKEHGRWRDTSKWRDRGRWRETNTTYGAQAENLPWEETPPAPQYHVKKKVEIEIDEEAEQSWENMIVLQVFPLLTLWVGRYWIHDRSACYSGSSYPSCFYFGS